MRTVLAMVLLAGLLILVLAVAAAGVGAHDPGLVVMGASGAVVLGAPLGFLLHVWLPRRRSGPPPTLTPAPDCGERGVRFGYAIRSYFWFTALVLVTLLTFTGTALVAALSGGVPGWVFAVGFAAPALLLGWYLLTVLRLAPGGLTLSPAGITHRGLAHLLRVPWRDVQAVGTVRLGTPSIVVRAALSDDTVVRRHTGRFDTGELRFFPFLVVREYWLANDPAMVLDALTFYQAHPELRGELATPDALRRIAAGRTRD